MDEVDVGVVQALASAAGLRLDDEDAVALVQQVRWARDWLQTLEDPALDPWEPATTFHLDDDGA